MKRRYAKLTGVGVAVAGALSAATPAEARRIDVTSASAATANDGSCTLPEAVIAVNTRVASSSLAGECPAGDGASDTIWLPSSAQTYTLTNSLAPTRDVVLRGAGASLSKIRSTARRVFEIIDTSSAVAGPHVTIMDLTIENASTDGSIVNGVYFESRTGASSLRVWDVTTRGCSNGVRVIGSNGTFNQVSLVGMRIENSRMDGVVCRGCDLYRISMQLSPT